MYCSNIYGVNYILRSKALLVWMQFILLIISIGCFIESFITVPKKWNVQIYCCNIGYPMSEYSYE